MSKHIAKSIHLCSREVNFPVAEGAILGWNSYNCKRSTRYHVGYYAK